MSQTAVKPSSKRTSEHDDASALSTALAYYGALVDKHYERVASLLDSKVELVSPMENLSGKEAVLKGAKGYSSMIKDFKIREKFHTPDAAVLIYDVDFGAPIGNCRTAAMMTVKDGKIARNELFFDSEPFKRK